MTVGQAHSDITESNKYQLNAQNTKLIVKANQAKRIKYTQKKEEKNKEQTKEARREKTAEGPKRAAIDVVGRQVASFDCDFFCPICPICCLLATSTLSFFWFFCFFFSYYYCLAAYCHCPLPMRRLIVIQVGGDFIMGITTQPSAELK